jgi:hypothetical protein
MLRVKAGVRRVGGQSEMWMDTITFQMCKCDDEGEENPPLRGHSRKLYERHQTRGRLHTRVQCRARFRSAGEVSASGMEALLEERSL